MCYEAGFKEQHSHSWPSTMSDAALVAIAQAGSHSAFIELFRRHQIKLGRTVQRITKNPHDTEDVLQDCSIKAFIHIKAFDGRSAFSSWLVRIAINTALMILRKRRRANIVSLDSQADSDLHGPWEITEPSKDPEQDLLEREEQFQVRQAVNRLPASLRNVLVLHRFQDRSLKELASMTGLSVAATKSRLFRAKLAIRHSVQRIQKGSFESLQ